MSIVEHVITPLHNSELYCSLISRGIRLPTYRSLDSYWTGSMKLYDKVLKTYSGYMIKGLPWTCRFTLESRLFTSIDPLFWNKNDSSLAFRLSRKSFYAFMVIRSTEMPKFDRNNVKTIIIIMSVVIDIVPLSSCYDIIFGCFLLVYMFS